jgi:glycine betaine transporter
MKNVRPLVFWLPMLLLGASLIGNLINPEGFLSTMTAINSTSLDLLSWVYSLATLAFVGTLAWAYLSPLGKVKIGGADATPILSKWNWFAITLCTTVAIGLLFWASAEPMYHVYSPPASLGIEPGSPDAKVFALSTMYLHWAITPYAIYTVPSLAFALAFYNLGKGYSLGSMLSVVMGRHSLGKGGDLIDSIALFALIAGMAGSLGTGMLTLRGGLVSVFGLESSTLLLLFIAITIVASFVISAASGLMNGIRILSALNTKFFFLLAGVFFVFGPTVYILSGAVDAIGAYLGGFFEKSLFTGAIAGDKWPQWWSNFYWANWLAWAPVTALFLGKLSRGYTVRDFINTTLLLPSLFAILWMSIFSGMAIFVDQTHNGVLKASLDTNGAESVVYTLFNYLPGGTMTGLIITIFFVVLAFVSFVTAADSNTEAIATLCEKRESGDDRPSSLPLKVVWGSMIGGIAFVMVSTSGIDGIKMLSNLGGIPALFIVLGAMLVLWKIGAMVSDGKAVTLKSPEAVSDRHGKPIVPY